MVDVPRAAVTDDFLYVSAADLLAFDRDGFERWRLEAGTPLGRGIAVGHGLVFAADDDGHEVIALEADTGDRRWTAPVREVSRPGAITVDGRTVYVSVRGEFDALEAATGDERARFDAGDHPSGPVVPTDDRLYQAVGDRVYALEGAR